MPAASAACNLTRPGRAKAVLRRLDHAMILAMIAGSCTPSALCALGPDQGYPAGRRGLGFIALCLAHGWMILPVLRSVIAALTPQVLVLLVGGGIVYSAGVLVHTEPSSGRAPYAATAPHHA